jgi:hypothetical protein
MHRIHVLNIANQSIISKYGYSVEVMSYEYRVNTTPQLAEGIMADL